MKESNIGKNFMPQNLSDILLNKYPHLFYVPARGCGKTYTWMHYMEKEFKEFVNENRQFKKRGIRDELSRNEKSPR